MKKNTSNDFLSRKAKKIRKLILKLAYEGKGAHISSSLSITDLLVTLYWDFLNISTKNIKSSERDRFILSKGHAVSALYAILSEKKIISNDLLKQYGKNNTLLAGHPEQGEIPGIEVSTGSLGHGLGVGAGLALAGKIDNKTYRVVVLLSDAECQEGTIWEAAMFAGHNKLSNLIVIVDYNNMQAFGKINETLDLQPFARKWKSFQWNVVELDAHDITSIRKSLFNLPHPTKPTAIIAYSIPAKGVTFMENKLEWHYLNLDKKLYKKALEEII